jgi:hypothetical protein
VQLRNIDVSITYQIRRQVFTGSFQYVAVKTVSVMYCYNYLLFIAINNVVFICMTRHMRSTVKSQRQEGVFVRIRTEKIIFARLQLVTCYIHVVLNIVDLYIVPIIYIYINN